MTFTAGATDGGRPPPDALMMYGADGAPLFQPDAAYEGRRRVFQTDPTFTAASPRQTKSSLRRDGGNDQKTKS